MAITAAITAAVTFSATSVYYTINRAGLTTPVTNTLQLKTKLDTINTYIDKNFLYDDIDYQVANDYAAMAYVASLEDPYTHYYSKEEFSDYISRVEESYVGIGIVISADVDNDKIVIVSPIKGSPAYKAGLKPDDVILSVDGVEYGANDMNSCVDSIKSGKEGTFVKIKIDRNGTIKNFTIERKEIVEESVQYEMLNDGIGYISISNFNINSDGSSQSSYSEFVEAVETLKTKGMKKLVIDVRDNPGGVLTVVCKIADYLLPEGLITYTETRTGARENYQSDKNELDIPMAVLINGSSASASEILAGALKAHNRATIIGTKSYGKGVVQKIFPFSDGSGMSMTVSKYFMPDGASIHKVGIEPDITVELPEEYKDSYISEIPKGKDTQLEKAIELLSAE